MPNIYQSEFLTPLGSMLAIADSNMIYLLKFSDSINQSKLNKYYSKLQKLRHCEFSIINKPNSLLEQTKAQLEQYFTGQRQEFNLPIHLIGTGFQKSVWQQLLQIPYGVTRSYSKLANSLNNPQAYRAVAKANSTNNIVLIIPCHRVINKNGQLGGYSDKVARKKYLIEHEQVVRKPMRTDNQHV